LIKFPYKTYFSEPLDLNTNALKFNYLPAGWPAYMNMDQSNGFIVGVSNFPQAATTLTIQAFDSYGVTCSMNFILTVLAVIPVSVLNHPKNLRIRSGYFFKHELEKRIFQDTQNMQPIVIWATLPGYHYTDPQLPSWLHFDPHNFLFSGQPPVSTTPYNLTVLLYGVDKFSNAANTSWTIEVFPNTNCTAKYPWVNITCSQNQFCALTIQPDYYNETETETLTYSLYSISNQTWAHWSDINGTLYGVPPSAMNVTLVVMAKDVVGLTCMSNYAIEVKI
jgi:hypothetical protein